MKRLFILLLYIVSAVSIYANPPKLNVYYRGLTVKNNPEIIKQIAEAIAKDQPRAKDFSDYQGNDGQYTSLQIVNNGETIYIGLQRDKTERQYI